MSKLIGDNFGVFPRPCQSSDTNISGDISRAGDASARAALFNAADVMLRDGKFEVAYIYPDEIDPDEDVVEHRARAVRRHFGEKPIVSPPWPPEDDAPDYGL